MTRRFTTAVLEKLMEGTPPGPWHHIGYGYLETSSGKPLNGKIDWDGAIRPDCGDIAAAAPELAAELHRIRTELEEQVRIWEKVSEKLENRGDKDGALQAKHTAAIVTRILNGDNNE